MTKENANPIIYQVTSQNEVESEFNVASRILKRWTHHPDQEEEEELLLLEQQATIAGRGSVQTSSSSSSSFPYYYDSLYHLEPHRYLTPSERSIKSTLANIEESFCKQKGNIEGPLDILQLAGIKTLTIKNQAAGGVTSPTNSTTSSSSAGMYFFKPSDSAISQQIQQQQQQEWDTITQREVFDMIRNIQDPEHPLTLEQLNVVNYSHIAVTDNQYSSSTTVPNNNNNNNNNNSDNHDAKEEETVHSFVDVKFTPTIPHCSMATLIGLCIRVKLLRSLPKRFKVTVRINPGTHASEVSINRQLNDKERVIAAMENVHLLSVVNKCIANGMQSSA